MPPPSNQSRETSRPPCPPARGDGTLDGARIAVTGNRKGAELAEVLRHRGATVMLGPTVSGDMPAPDEAILSDTRSILASDPRWLVATTGVGMRVWADVAQRGGMAEPLRAWAARATCVARGAKATGGLAALGLRPAWVSPNNTDRDVVAWLRTRIVPGDPVVAQLHGGQSTAYDDLLASGADLLTVVPYRWQLPDDPEPARDVIRAVLSRDLDIILFTSAGAVTNLLVLAQQLGDRTAEQVRAALAGGVAVASVGPVTAEAVEVEGGINTVLPRRWRTGDLVRGVEGWWRRRDEPGMALGLRLHPDRSSVQFGDGLIELGPREYAVLAALSRRPGVVVRTDQLIIEGWGHQAPADLGSVKHQIARLRRKLSNTGVQIETVRGAGYRIAAQPRPPT